MNSIKNTNKFVLVLFLNQLILSLFWGLVMDFLNVPLVLNLILSQICVFGIPATLYFIYTKESPKKVLRLNPISFVNILLIIGISIFIQPIMTLLSAITSIFFTNNVSELLIETDNIPLWLMLIGTALTPAIFEELFFRGIVFYGYKTTSLIKASLMTGLLFGLMHMDLQQFLYAFAMGTVFCFLVYKTKSIFASVISHFTINASQIALYSLFTSSLTTSEIDMSLNPTFMDVMASIFSSILLVVASLPFLALLIWAFLKVNKNTKIDTDEIYYNLPKNMQEPIATKSLAFAVGIFFLQVIIIPVIVIFIYIILYGF